MPIIMNHDLRLIERQHQLLTKITSLTAEGNIHWERQKGSSHRFANWDEVLLILGPGESSPNDKAFHYLHITPLFSLKWLEINTNDPKLHDSLLQLRAAVEEGTKDQLPTDPFALTDDLKRLLNK